MIQSAMKRAAPSILATLTRCLKLRCPVCGRASIIQRPFHIKHQCNQCSALFKREEGFFVGAILANVVATEGSILVTYFVLLLARVADQSIFTILFAMAVGFPLAFYHHAWALWLGMDHLIEGLPRLQNREP
jgi:uncharacterized protein (DUF983 family)